MLSAMDLLVQMSVVTGMLPDHLRSIIQTAPLRYKVFQIKKRNGGFREIAQPAKEVKIIQRWLVETLANVLPVHDAATAYMQGSSIKRHASVHRQNSYILKMDFQNFFPSISAKDIARHLHAHCGSNFDLTAIKLIRNACSWAPSRQSPLRLCIGAPSSPFLSNTVMYEFDTRLTKMAHQDGVAYTRYADDLALSAKKPGVLEPYIRHIADLLREIKYPTLAVNRSKTVLASRAGRRVLTGIVLTPDFGLSIGRDRKRLIRSMYHRATLNRLSSEDQAKLKGWLAFADSIEPGFSSRLKKQAVG